ncbi:MAG: hypothetical protein J4F38_12120 [Pseudomonadales bacterium]|nr:hypothetical protein [Pseudomonadales bacterium]
MRAAVVFLLTSLGAVVCLAEESESTDSDSPPVENQSTVEEILENPLADDDYRDERSCLRRREIDSIEIIDESLVVFRGRIKKRVWVNRFSQPCVGLRRDMVVTTRARTGSICRLDAIDARPHAASPFEPAVRCYLGGFIAIDEVQVEAMKRAVDEHAKAGQRAAKANGR